MIGVTLLRSFVRLPPPVTMAKFTTTPADDAADLLGGTGHLARKVAVQPARICYRTGDGAACQGCETGCKLRGTIERHSELRRDW